MHFLRSRRHGEIIVEGATFDWGVLAADMQKKVANIDAIQRGGGQGGGGGGAVTGGKDGGGDDNGGGGNEEEDTRRAAD